MILVRGWAVKQPSLQKERVHEGGVSMISTTAYLGDAPFGSDFVFDGVHRPVVCLKK